MATKFRTSFTHKEGHDPARVVQGSIVNINLVKWTVDVVAKFDRKKYFNIQVAGLYLHHSNGEGVYCFPEVGATCMVCIPSDSAPPFVQCFVMASELVDDVSADAPLGTASHAQPPANVVDSSFAGGRLPPKPGDIVMRTRDGNFVILHRGGVLQIGATELSQRIFIPLSNLMMDVSENYEHHNTNGSVVWGIQNGPSQTQIPSQKMETFRVFATDQFADIKICTGKVFSPVAEPDGKTTLNAAGIGDPIIYEVTVSPMGFIAESGAQASSSTVSQSVMKFTFDRKGNTLLRTEGNLYFKVAKKLTLKVAQDIAISTDAAGTLTAANGFDIDGGTHVFVKGQLVRFNDGKLAVARVTDTVQTPVPGVPVVITFASPPVPGQPAAGTLTIATPLVGKIVSGNTTVLA
jgi:hypothetical protein